MRRYILVLGPSTPEQQHAVGRAIAARGAPHAAWWHYFPTLWLIVDNGDRPASQWVEIVRQAVPEQMVLCLRGEDASAYGFVPTSEQREATTWMHTNWPINVGGT